VQSPGPTIVTTNPDTVHTDGFKEINETSRFDDAVGVTVIVDGSPVKVVEPGFDAVMVWGSRVEIGNVLVTGVAAQREPARFRNHGSEFLIVEHLARSVRDAEEKVVAVGKLSLPTR